MSGDWAAFRSCARQELRLAVRSRWMLAFAAVFTGLSLAVASAGYILTGGFGLQDFARTAASLVELVILLVPIAALLFGVMAFAGEAGSSELLFSQPVGRATILLGRLAGLFAALVAAETIGFGFSGLVVFTRTGADGAGKFAGVLAAAIVLTALFLAAAAAIAAGGATRSRARALAVALVVWFAGVVLFDAAALGVGSMLPSGTASRTLIVATIVNPVDAVRTATLMAIEGTAAFGAASLAFLRFTGGAALAGVWLAASALVWIGAALAIAVVRLSRADI